jgi:ATP-dependent Clp protease ATP-binding subunit ClpA
VTLFERFTERARQVVVLAGEEAHGLKHGYIGTEHILLGLIREEDGVAAQVLDSLDITLERVRGEVVRTVGVGHEEHVGQVPFTPRAKKVLELSLREALSLGHNYIGTEHILLGLILVENGVSAQILRDCEVTPDQIRNAVIRALPGHAPPPEPSVREVPVPRGPAFDEWIRVGPGAGVRRLLMVAAARALDDGRSAIEPNDMLLALIRDPQIGPLLAELGVDEGAVRGALERRRQSPPPPQATAEG